MPTPPLSLSLSLSDFLLILVPLALSVPHPPRPRCPHGARYPIRRLPSPRNIFVASCLARLSRLASRLSQPAVPGCIERDHYNRPSITTLHITHYKLPVSFSLSLSSSLSLPPSLPLSLSLGSLLLHGSSHPTRAAASFRGLIFLSFFLSFRAEASFLARGLARNTRQMFRRAPALVISSPLSAGRREQSRREIGKVG